MDSSNRVMVDGRDAASLYQTYGVPPELLQNLAAERNFTFDWNGYRQAMAEHEEISGSGRKELFQTGPIETLKEALLRTDFLGYESTTADAVVKGIVIGSGDNSRLIGHVRSGGDPSQSIRVVLDRSPFYGESGGQVGDQGIIENADFRFHVTDTQRAGELIIHVGHLERGDMKEGTACKAIVDQAHRDAIRRAHSATHMLHHALQTELGKHAQQQGSKVEPDSLRFDFTNQESVGDDQLERIESLVQNRINEASPVSWRLLPLAEARNEGAMMLFGEKYPDPVRMVSMGSFSKELCGGTHLTNTKEVVAFEILSDESVSAGTRRIAALTGQRALAHRERIQSIAVEVAKIIQKPADQIATAVGQLTQSVRKLKKQVAGGGAGSSELTLPAIKASTAYGQVRSAVRQIARMLNVSPEEIPSRLQALISEEKSLEQQLQALADSGKLSADDLLKSSEVIDGVRVVVAETPGANPNLMRQWIDQIRKKESAPTAVLLGCKSGDDKVVLVCGLSQALLDRNLTAGDWITPVAAIVGGGGGGKPDLAQAGGKFPEKLAEALASAKKVWSEISKA
jgi:alanyl-tRNA synthetase